MTLTNELLGYTPDARLLILNADDFGLCNSTNEAIIRALEAGLVRSTSLMIPCPWAQHAVHFLSDHPEVPFAVHLTILSDAVDYSWGPLSPHDEIPSLLDERGRFYNNEGMPRLFARARLDEIEMEFRAQVNAVLASGLRPTHLDWHSLRLHPGSGGRSDIFDLMVSLAREYGLAMRIAGREAIKKLQALGLPVNDFDFIDSYQIDPAVKSAEYSRLLRELPPGLSEWAVHPGFDTLELLALEPDGNHARQADYDFWTSQQAREIIKAEGIILLDYRPLQEIWRNR